jgi:hypothetical protein
MKEESPPPGEDQQDDPFFQPHLTDSFSQVNHTPTTREGRFPGIPLGLPLYNPANDQAALRTKYFPLDALTWRERPAATGQPEPSITESVPRCEAAHLIRLRSSSAAR